MCGIAGVLGPPGRDAGARRATLEMMAGCLAHRGPDASGTWEDGPVGLAHRRLAVLGLGEAGAQPMVSASGRYVIVYNGEVYNHPALRAELERSGRAPVWRGSSDTETLLAGIEAWGLDALLTRSVGMFALAFPRPPARWPAPSPCLSCAWGRSAETYHLNSHRHGSPVTIPGQPSPSPSPAIGGVLVQFSIHCLTQLPILV